MISIPDNILTRYLFERGHYSPNNNRVKYAAFMPSKTGETSVYLTKGIPDEKIWCLGLVYVEPKRRDRKKIQARGDVAASQVLKENLSIEIDPIPHHRHANIINWPDLHAKCLMIAKKIEESARLNIYSGEPDFKDCQDLDLT